MLRPLFATFKMLAIYLTLGPIAGIIGIPYTLAAGNVTRLYRAGMSIMRAGVRAAGIRTTITGLQHVPAGRSCIFMSNHVSNLDPPVLLPAIPGRCSVLLKRELMSIPILGTAMKMGGFIPVDRAAEGVSRREAALRSVAAAADALQQGLHIVVFPEGTRSLDGRLARFKKGPFFLAEQTGAPIIPVAISGTEKLMRKGSVLISPGPVRIDMLAPIDPAQYSSRDALMAAVREAIATALPAEMKPAE